MDSFFLKDLAVVIAVAAGTTFICRWWRQPVVIGYILAGLLIGPHTPPFQLVQDLHSIHTMAELGLIVLMFTMGMEFSLPKLRKVGTRAAAATVLEIFGMLAVGYATGRALGWSINDSIYLGAILSISSTTIIIKVLSDLKMTQEPFAQAVFGILILEDIAAVAILTILSGLGARQEVPGLSVLRSVGEIGFFVVLFLILGLIFVPRLLKLLARFKSSEMTGLTAFGLCLASALLAQHFGFSVALGAFLIGAVIGVSPEVEHIEKWIHPIRDLFSALFFVSAGLLIDPHLLWTIRGPVAIITGVTIIGKIAAGTMGSLLAGYSTPTASRIGMTLAQIGEFSFVFAALGLKTGIGSPMLYPMAVSVSALTTLVTPYLIRHSDALARAMIRWGPASLTGRLHNRSDDSEPAAAGTSRILSRYLWRLMAYTALLCAGFWVANMAATLAWKLSLDIPYLKEGIWLVSWVCLLPFVHAVATYVNHFMLLALTEMIVRTRASGLLQKIPIQGTYIVSEAMIWVALTFTWLTQAFHWRTQPVVFASGLGIMALIAWAGRKPIRKAYDLLEEHLDDIIGLASSEPLRPAAIAVAGPDSMLNESIQRVMINRTSQAVHQSLRSLQIRDRTGSSVIAIYRNGALNANPAPDTVLEAGDILVLLGNTAQSRKARQYLQLPS